MAEPPARADLAARLRAATPARVALGRVGSGLPTGPMLDFQLAHARARDAVHALLPAGGLGTTIAGLPVIEVRSRAADRATYLARPDLGRRVVAEDLARLTDVQADVAIVIADGLSATAAIAHAGAICEAIVARMTGWRFAPIVVAHEARVALADEVGAALGVDLVIALIGERPGLSAADSLGAYLTWAPRIGRPDSERNCVSNIRPAGLPLSHAAEQIAALASAARALGQTGVALKPPETVDQLA